ncbi:MAG: TonB-dependent receptor, partial [Myxococcota bacterium]
VRGQIDHFDARWEYYFSPDEVASVAVFGKLFYDPVERTELGGVDRSVSYTNADSANNIGLEIEARRRLGSLAEDLGLRSLIKPLEDVFTAVNIAFIRSRVDLGEDGGTNTSTRRPLQGQSPFVINVQAGYDDAAGSGITAVVLYNVFGSRIRDVGRFGTPDVYEEPYHQLDFVYSQKFGDAWSLKFKASNLLDQQVKFTQGPRVQASYRNGRSFGLSLSWSY